MRTLEPYEIQKLIEHEESQAVCRYAAEIMRQVPGVTRAEALRVAENRIRAEKAKAR